MMMRMVEEAQESVSQKLKRIKIIPVLKMSFLYILFVVC
jgi:hypothetical protein